MTAAVAPGRIWSPQQEAIFAAIEDDSLRHLVVEALAGTGKTTTAIEALRHTWDGQSVLLAAFNKSIATELKSRAPAGVEVCTWHAFGLRAVTRGCGRRQIDGDQGRRYAAAALGDDATRERKAAVVRLASLAKGCLTDPSPIALGRLADAQQVDIEEEDRVAVLAATARALRLAAEASTAPIDFDDMIWLPVVRNLPVPSYDWVFVDEAQDLNPCQLELACRAGAKGRIVVIGDRHQSIYGFRGADRSAIPGMISRLQATRLPLSVTYRCPKAVVRDAARLVPEFTAAPSAPEGTVRDATDEVMRREARAGDFILSRVNAPLVSLAFKWLREGRACHIQGRDIGAGLAGWVRSRKVSGVEDLLKAVSLWETAEIRRLDAEEKDTEHVVDRAECLRAMCEGASSVSDVVRRIEELFQDGGGGIKLSSTHRAKGLEADRVWLLRETYLKRMNEEEKNLLYVAITRAKRELIYVYPKKNEEAA